MGYGDIKTLLTDARNLATGANDIRTVSILKDIQLEVYDLLEENRNLRQEINDLKNDKITKNSLELKHNAYYEIGKNVPYCTRCFDVDNKLVTLHKKAPINSTYFKFYCPGCDKRFDSGIPHGQNTTVSF